MIKSKYYVFDKYDCFFHCDTLEEATEKAAELISHRFTGVHIKEFTITEFTKYCTG